jgi:serine/threonine protein kinase
VWRALCKPFNSFVAVKLLDLDSINCNLEEIMREVQIMKLVNHENILSLHCSFVNQDKLWVVMPYVKGGSVLNIMKYAFPQVLVLYSIHHWGFEQAADRPPPVTHTTHGQTHPPPTPLSPCLSFLQTLRQIIRSR